MAFTSWGWIHSWNNKNFDLCLLFTFVAWGLGPRANALPLRPTSCLLTETAMRRGSVSTRTQAPMYACTVEVSPFGHGQPTMLLVCCLLSNPGAGLSLHTGWLEGGCTGQTSVFSIQSGFCFPQTFTLDSLNSPHPAFQLLGGVPIATRFPETRCHFHCLMGAGLWTAESGLLPSRGTFAVATDDSFNSKPMGHHALSLLGGMDLWDVVPQTQASLSGQCCAPEGQADSWWKGGRGSQSPLAREANSPNAPSHSQSLRTPTRLSCLC